MTPVIFLSSSNIGPKLSASLLKVPKDCFPVLAKKFSLSSGVTSSSAMKCSKAGQVRSGQPYEYEIQNQ